MTVTLSHPTDNVTTLEGHWIWAISDPRVDDQQNCHFRCKFRTSELGTNPKLRISADSRYRVWINETFVGRGPCRGTLDHYNYEIYDIADLLADGDGENILSIDVRWYGSHSPVAEIHARAGLWAMLGGDETPAAIFTDDNPRWRCIVSDGFATDPIPASAGIGAYCVVDSCEDVDLRRLPRGWDTLDFDDASWSHCKLFMPACGPRQNLRHTHFYHDLMPSEIPPLMEEPISPHSIMQAGAINPTRPPETARFIQGELVPDGKNYDAVFWGDKPTPLVFDEPGTHYVIVNMGAHTTAYPIISVNTHVGAMVEMRYTEALSNNRKKGVRDDLASGTVEGYFDLFTCCEGKNSFEPYVWRSFRFVRIAIHHPDGPAAIECFNPVFTTYPFEQIGEFKSSDPLLDDIWDISWRTAQLCAHEHYEDCPYYEQLQYVGDTRLQALISYIVTGDFRLARQALRQYADTRRQDGITKSRTPSSVTEMQIIPQFSLIWILFLEDFYLHSGDSEFVRQCWDCVESVLKWFDKYTEDDGLIHTTPYWNFTDWSMRSDNHRNGSIGELNIRRVASYKAANRMAQVLGLGDRAVYFDQQAATFTEAINGKLRNADGLYVDNMDGEVIGEQATLVAILYDLVDADEAMRLIKLVDSRDDLARCTIYYSYYAFRAYEKMGMFEDAWTKRLHVWTDQLKLHATTWFESPDPRSDCHAWGSWLMCDMLNCILGVRAAEVGFKKVIVKPHLLDLENASGKLVTANGIISGSWRRRGSEVEFEYELPAGVTGTLIAPDATTHELTEGTNHIKTKG